jgi:hypothetical protein
LDEAAKYFISAGLVPSEILDNEIDLMRYLKVWTSSWVPRVTVPPGNCSSIVDIDFVSESLVDLIPDSQYWRKTTLELYEMFSTFKYGAICGHVGWTLMSVYESFGFKAFTYNYGKQLESKFTHIVTLVQLSNNCFYIQDGDFGTEHHLGSTDDQISNSLHQITTMETMEVTEYEKLVRSMISNESLIRNQKDVASTFPPVGSVAVSHPPEKLGDGRLLWRNVSVTPKTLNQVSTFDSVMNFLRSEGESCTINAMMLYPLGISSRSFGYVTAQDSGESLNKSLLKIFAKLRP